MRPKAGKRDAKVRVEEEKVPNPFSVYQPPPGAQQPSEAINEDMFGRLGYRFNAQMALESVSGAPFQFESELHYDAIGSYVAGFVQSMLREVCGLAEVWLPQKNAQKFCVFQSRDWTTNQNKALVIIPGKGKVSLGQWSRRICVNEGLAAGSMLNYLMRAAADGYSVLVMNCNARTQSVKTNEESAVVTWRACLPQCPAKDVYVVAHSWGGKCTVHLLKTCFSDVSRRVVGVAFTDSVHKTVADLPRLGAEFLKAKAVNWVKSARPLNEVVVDRSRSRDGCENRSAGTTVHEYTSSSAIDCVFDYLQTCVRRVQNRPGLRPKCVAKELCEIGVK